ncbi:F-box/LRR-repeat protein 8 [Anguilla rostrata]|uniref:F-box/LRR-repeat protein 8 n=1 Tax=Anguilla rostrata TaxID=7938 RepID=UPI0030D592E0
MEFPEEVLAHIFSYLPLWDRYSASLVCKAWSQTMTHPFVWYYTEVRCESGAEAHGLPQFCQFLRLARHLKISIRHPKEESGRGMAVRALGHAAGAGSRLSALRISCTGEFPLFYSGEDVLQGIRAAFLSEAGGLSLREVDLREMPFTLNDSLVLDVARRSPGLRRLFINNKTLVCNVTTETLREVLGLCPQLCALGAFYASLSEEVLGELLRPGRAPFSLLELYCERSDKYAHVISDRFWEALRRRHPSLAVNVVLNHTLPARMFLKILQPSLPVRDLDLVTFTDLANELAFAAGNYGDTLERLVLQTSAPGGGLDSALVGVAERCARLREVHCYCVVSPRVIAAFLERCPHLWRYTLKTTKERHPWTCTVLK